MKDFQTFYLCGRCGNLAAMIADAGVPLSCCGQVMKKLIPNENDPTRGKHSPVIEIDGDKCHIKVGADPHSMTKEHQILWIYIVTEKGGQRKYLPAGAPAEVTFALADDKVIAAYSYCNVHGLKLVMA